MKHQQTQKEIKACADLAIELLAKAIQLKLHPGSPAKKAVNQLVVKLMLPPN